MDNETKKIGAYTEGMKQMFAANEAFLLAIRDVTAARAVATALKDLLRQAETAGEARRLQDAIERAEANANAAVVHMERSGEMCAAAERTFEAEIET